MYEDGKKKTTSDKNSMFAGQLKAKNDKFHENFRISCIKY